LLKQINLNGDAINLAGQGELKLDGRPIHRLAVPCQDGTRQCAAPDGMLREASQQILQIHVAHARHPVTDTQAFPVAKGALQQLQAIPAARPSPVPD